MTRTTLLIAAAALAASGLIGCTEPFGEFGGLGDDARAGTRKPLGAVTYDAALAAGQKALSQHFSLLPMERKGVLKSRPKFVQAEAGGLLKVTPTSRREIATLYLASRDEQIVAQLAIQVEQQGSGAFRSLGAEDEYSSAPHRTPAQEEAATTPEQNQLWRPAGRDRPLERRILSQIHQILHPAEAAKEPPPKAPPAEEPPAEEPPAKEPPAKEPPAKAEKS